MPSSDRPIRRQRGQHNQKTACLLCSVIAVSGTELFTFKISPFSWCFHLEDLKQGVIVKSARKCRQITFEADTGHRGQGSMGKVMASLETRSTGWRLWKSTMKDYRKFRWNWNFIFILCKKLKKTNQKNSSELKEWHFELQLTNFYIGGNHHLNDDVFTNEVQSCLRIPLYSPYFRGLCCALKSKSAPAGLHQPVFLCVHLSLSMCGFHCVYCNQPPLMRLYNNAHYYY